MKITFIAFECESYSIMLFSALLKEKGHQVDLIFDPRLFATDEIANNNLFNLFDIRKQNIEKIKRINPDLIGFSVYTQDYQYALSFARMIKKELPNTPIIFGGIHCILCPETVIKEDCVDMVCVGEGEKALVEMVEKSQKDTKGWNFPIDISNIWIKDYVFSTRSILYPSTMRPLIQDLDSLPFIDRELFYQQKPVFKKDLTISTGRGCPFQCTYCASAVLGETYREQKLGKYVRQRSVESVLNELLHLKRLYSPRSIYFTDDVFTLSVKWLRGFASKYKRCIGLPFYCTANPGTIKNEELELLKLAGCQMIGFGMQSCNEEYRKTYLKRSGTNVRIIEVANMCRRLGIRFSFDHIFNLPNEPMGNQDEAVLFYNETRPDIINTFDMTYLPKIELNKYLSTKEQEEVNNGKAKTSMFARRFDNYSSIFCLLSLVSHKWITFLCNKNLARFIRFPYPIRLLLKDIKRLMIGRYSDVFFPIRLILTNIKDNILIKCRIKL